MLRFSLNYLQPGEHATIAQWLHRNTAPAPLHVHTFHELFWVDSGEGVHWINGDERPLSVGSLAIIHPEDAHCFSTTQEAAGLKLTNFACFSPLWKRVAKRCIGEAGPSRFFSQDHRQREAQLSPSMLDRLRLLAGDLNAGFLDRLSTEAFLTSLFSLLINQDARADHARSAPGWLVKACEAIRSYPHFRHGTRVFVKLAGRSPEHVARECKKHFGKTPRDFVTEARLSYAASLLCTSDLPILDVAFETGFENVGHFYQRFRARYGTSPHRYRLEHHSAPHGH